MLFSKSIRFPSMFDISVGNTAIDEEYISINRCIALILTTAKGELLGDPDYGCTLYEQLFNPYVDSQKDIIILEILNALQKYEKRITVKNSDITIERDENDEHTYNIHINYAVRNSDLVNKTIVTIQKGDSTHGE